MALIAADRLGKDYRSAAGWRDLAAGRLRGALVPALAQVSLDVAAGEVVAVLGRNGAGKSTLLKCLAGLLTPSRGTSTVAGHDLARSSGALRRDAVYVAADARSFAWRLSGRANLEFFAALHGWDRAGARARVVTSLARVGLGAAVADRRVAEYSTGMRQRLALARGLLGDPRVVLLDEPTAGIDPRSAIEVRALVRELAGQGRAVVVATHMPDEARELASRAIVLDDGHVLFAGPVGEAVDLVRGVARG